MCKFLTFEKLNKIKNPCPFGAGGVGFGMTDMSTFVEFEGVHGICVCVERAVCAVDVAVSLAELVDVGQYVKTHTKLNLVLY